MSRDKWNVLFASGISIGGTIGNNILRLFGRPRTTTAIEDIVLCGFTAYVLIMILTFGPKLKTRANSKRSPA